MSNILALLSSHFDALQPRKVEIKGIPEPLLFDPLTTEQALAYVNAANARSAAEQARGFAELLVATVKQEDGEPAFPLAKGGPNPIEILTKRTPPLIFSRLVKALAAGTDEQAVNEAVKKSESPVAASSSATTSSPSEPAATSTP